MSEEFSIKNEMPVPDAALRDKDAVEMLRVWIAEKKLQCSINVGMYQENEQYSEGIAWGIILADVTRHVAMAMESGFSASQPEVIKAIRDSFLKELDKPTSDTSGKFVHKN